MSEAAWARLLERFEDELAIAATGTGTGTGTGTAWHPPLDAGPLPASLAPRARIIAAAQAARAERLGGELAALRTQLDALARIPSGSGDDAVYLDLDG
ncbi:MAG: hypothetical protein PGN24_11195 [Microbacterium arborescens]